MAKIDKRRVLLGGLLAGLVINICEMLLYQSGFGEQWEQVMFSLNRQPPQATAVTGMAIAMFAVGFFIIWLYAAIRPRFGKGPKTAVYAGVAVWFIYYVVGFGGTIFMDIFPAGLVLFGIIAGFVECVLAALVGGWVYTETELETDGA